jgi:hypothetical protein
MISLFDSAHHLATVELMGPVVLNLDLRLPTRVVTTLTVSAVAPALIRPAFFLGVPALVELNFESMSTIQNPPFKRR